MNEYKWKTTPVWAFWAKLSQSCLRFRVLMEKEVTFLKQVLKQIYLHFFPLSSRVCLKFNIMVQNHRTVFSTMYILAKVNSDKMSIFNHFTLLFPPK